MQGFTIKFAQFQDFYLTGESILINFYIGLLEVSILRKICNEKYFFTPGDQHGDYGYGRHQDLERGENENRSKGYVATSPTQKC